jgi:hypothetical protein
MQSQEDFATDLAGWGLLPGSLNGKLAVWEADATANLAAWPSEFAEAAAEAACDPTAAAKEARPLQKAAAAAAAAAGLMAPHPPGMGGVRGAAARGTGTGQWTKMAAAAADNVRHNHAQLQTASGAAAALTNALTKQWQAHSSWRASRVAVAGALSLQRCGLDLLLLPGAGGTLQQQAGAWGYSSGPLVSGSWLPMDACGVPVGVTSNGRFPDAAAYASAAAVCSQLVLLPGGERASAGGSKKGPAGAAGGCRSSSNRLPLCGWDLVRAVGDAAHPVAACLRGRTGATALRDLSSLVLEVSVSVGCCKTLAAALRPLDNCEDCNCCPLDMLAVCLSQMSLWPLHISAVTAQGECRHGVAASVGFFLLLLVSPYARSALLRRKAPAVFFQ